MELTVYRAASVRLTAGQVDALDSAINENATGSGCVYVDVEVLADPENNFRALPSGMVESIVEFCQRENVAEVQVYC